MLCLPRMAPLNISLLTCQMVLVGVVSLCRIPVILSWCGPRNSTTTFRRRCVLATSSWMTALTSLWALASETHSDWVIHVPSSLETRLKLLWSEPYRQCLHVTGSHSIAMTSFNISTPHPNPREVTPIYCCLPCRLQKMNMR